MNEQVNSINLLGQVCKATLGLSFRQLMFLLLSFLYCLADLAKVLHAFFSWCSGYYKSLLFCFQLIENLAARLLTNSKINPLLLGIHHSRHYILYPSYLYKAELSPAEYIADRREGGYSQKEIQAKSQNPNNVVRVSTPGHGGIKWWRFVLPDLKITVNKEQTFLPAIYRVREVWLKMLPSLTCEIVCAASLYLT